MTIRANRTLEDRARFGLGSDTQDDETDPATDETPNTAEGVIEAAAITDPEITTVSDALTTHSTADLAAANHGLPKISVVDGEDETATHQITVTGMAAGDIVVGVLVLTTKASIATAALHAGTLTAAAGKITPGTEVDNTGNQYVIFWIDCT